MRCVHEREHGMAQVAAESLLRLVKEAGASLSGTRGRPSLRALRARQGKVRVRVRVNPTVP